MNNLDRVIKTDRITGQPHLALVRPRNRVAPVPLPQPGLHLLGKAHRVRRPFESDEKRIAGIIHLERFREFPD